MMHVLQAVLSHAGERMFPEERKNLRCSARPTLPQQLISASNTALADVPGSKQLKYPASALDKLPSNCSQEKPLGWPSVNLTPIHMPTEPFSRDFYPFPASLLQIWGNLN